MDPGSVQIMCSDNTTVTKERIIPETEKEILIIYDIVFATIIIITIGH
jgi:hypothetical protein